MVQCLKPAICAKFAGSNLVYAHSPYRPCTRVGRANIRALKQAYRASPTKAESPHGSRRPTMIPLLALLVVMLRVYKTPSRYLPNVVHFPLTSQITAFLVFGHHLKDPHPRCRQILQRVWLQQRRNLRALMPGTLKSPAQTYRCILQRGARSAILSRSPSIHMKYTSNHTMIQRICQNFENGLFSSFCATGLCAPHVHPQWYVAIFELLQSRTTDCKRQSGCPRRGRYFTGSSRRFRSHHSRHQLVCSWPW